MNQNVRTKLTVAAVTTGLVLATPVSVQAAMPFPADPPAKSAAVTPADPALPVTFYLGLRRDEKGAAKQLKLRSNPKRTYYRHWLKPGKIAREYGAATKTVNGVKRYLGDRGIAVKLDKSRVFARITGTVAAIQDTFQVTVDQEIEDGIRYLGTNALPVVPAAIQSDVTEVVFAGVQQLSAQAQSRGGHEPPSLAVPAPQNQGTPIHACETVKADPNTMTFEQAAKAYTIDKVRSRLGYGLKRKGDVIPKAPRLGIVSMGSGFSQTAANAAAQCLGWDAKPARVITTDGMQTPLPEGVEGNLDQQMSSAMMLRTTRVSTYEAIYNETSWFTPLFAALNDPQRPPVLSVSYGVCEAMFQTQSMQPVLRLAESVLLRLGLAGTTVFVAAGDDGSSTCYRMGMGEQLSTAYPATSRYVTAVGGTRLVLNKQNRRAGEVVWNDSDFTGGNFANNPSAAIGGGGGGNSTLFKRQWWQKGKTGSKTQRTVPDVSAHGAGAPAWPVYITEPADQTGWHAIWGTSSSSPLTAAAFAMIVAKEQTEGRPTLGFVNPWLYSVKRPYAQGFFDVVSGNNDLFDQGCCSATKGYDRASGIGVPQFANLQKLLPKAG